MGLILFVALIVVGFLYVKRRITGKETPEDQKMKSRLGAAMGGGAVPRLLGAQSSVDLPEGFARDEIGPAESNVFVMEAKAPSPPTFHPFRAVDETSAKEPAPRSHDSGETQQEDMKTGRSDEEN